MIDTVPKLVSALSEYGALQSKLEIYDVNGNSYEIVELYHADAPNEDTLCIDLQKVG